MDSDQPGNDNVKWLVADHIKELLLKELEPYKGLLINTDLKLSITKTVMDIISKNKELYPDMEHIQLIVEADVIVPSKVNISPQNIFTALLFNDDYIPYTLVKDVEECETDKGHYSLMKTKDGKIYIEFNSKDNNHV